MDVVQYQECVGYLRDHKYPKRVHDSDKIREKKLKKRNRADVQEISTRWGGETNAL